MSKINLLAFISPNDTPFLNSMVENGFCQFVDFPMHICNNILDIVLADDDQI